MLGVLTAEQLRHAVFPIGDTPKPQIREEAARRGLAVAEKPDSHDICFIPSGDTRAFLGARIGVRRGAVVDAGGTVLAEHDGVHGFTIGQRKGLGIAGPGPDGRPRYVTAIDADTGDRARRRRRRPRGVDADRGAARCSPPAPRRAGPWSARCRCARTAASPTPSPSCAASELVGRSARPAARCGAGPDDGALPRRRRRRRGDRQRHDRAQRLAGHLVHDVRHHDVGHRLGKRAERDLDQHHRS